MQLHQATISVSPMWLVLGYYFLYAGEITRLVQNSTTNKEDTISVDVQEVTYVTFQQITFYYYEQVYKCWCRFCDFGQLQEFITVSHIRSAVYFFKKK